jgi:hypothetical protein
VDGEPEIERGRRGHELLGRGEREAQERVVSRLSLSRCYRIQPHPVAELRTDIPHPASPRSFATTQDPRLLPSAQLPRCSPLLQLRHTISRVSLHLPTRPLHTLEGRPSSLDGEKGTRLWSSPRIDRRCGGSTAGEDLGTGVETASGQGESEGVSSDDYERFAKGGKGGLRITDRREGRGAASRRGIARVT